MSYAQRKQLSGNPTLSIIFTVIVVGGLMYAIVTGLAYNVVKKTVQEPEDLRCGGEAAATGSRLRLRRRTCRRFRRRR